jgi:methionyl-tRNA formyltransferase
MKILKNSPQKNAVVIGETKFCLHCIEYLIDKDWNILAVISSDEIVINALKQKSIPIISLYEFASSIKSFNNNFYLFSIINPNIIPNHIISNNRLIYAFNYHDSLLPKYAGINSTTWAIINNEKVHGITWHLISSGIDEGDILVQRSVELEDNESVLSLNLKCTNTAYLAFIELIDKIAKTELLVQTQNIDKKSYFGRNYIPNNYAILQNNQNMKPLQYRLKIYSYKFLVNFLCYFSKISIFN